MAQPQADQAPADQHALRNAAIGALAAQQLAAAWPQIDWSSPQAVDAVKRIYAAVVTRFGSASASVAAEFYDQQRAQALPQAGTFRATPADPIPTDVLDMVVESAFRGNDKPAEGSAQTTSDLPVEERVPARLESSLQRHVQQPARDTITENVAADPVKPYYIRVPKGKNPCAFCIMLASRSASYKGKNQMYQTAQSAKFVVGRGKEIRRGRRGGRAKGTREYIAGGTGTIRTDTGAQNPREIGEKYHDHCYCEPIAVFPGQSITDVSPDFEQFQEMYAKATAEAGTSTDARAILSAMRRVYKVR